MRKRDRIIALAIAGIVTFTGCADSESNQSLGNYGEGAAGSSAAESSVETDLSDKIKIGEIDDYYSIVCSSVAYQLNEAGFETSSGAATSTESLDYNAVGIYYFSEELSFWDDASCQPVGFVEVVNDSAPFRNISEEDCMISVVDTNGSDTDIQRICTYNYNEIGSDHLVYKDKYITYYQQSPMRVVYSVEENNEDNYDLELGSLFDYDTQEFIYDESIFTDEYVSHSAIALTEEIDYAALEKTLQEISEQQEENGYTVESFEIAYISPENLQAYIDSQEEDTFFGTPVNELTKAFSAGKALVFENGELNKAQILNHSGDDDYRFSECLTKCGIGMGALLVSAAVHSGLNPSKIALDFVIVLTKPLSEGLVKGFHELVKDTAANIENGASVEEAIKLAFPHALKSFTDKFYVTAANVSVKNTIGFYNPIRELNITRIKNKIAGKDPKYRKSLKTIVEKSAVYNASIDFANAALQKINPNLNIKQLQNSIESTKQNFHDTVIKTAKNAAEYITVTANNISDKAVTVLMMPWTRSQT